MRNFQDAALKALEAEYHSAVRSKEPKTTADAIGMITAYYAQLIGIEAPAYIMQDNWA